MVAFCTVFSPLSPIHVTYSLNGWSVLQSRGACGARAHSQIAFPFPEVFTPFLRQGLYLGEVKGPTLGFSSGHDLTVCGFKPHVRLCADGVEPAWDSLSAPSLAQLLPTCAVSVSLNK